MACRRSGFALIVLLSLAACTSRPQSAPDAPKAVKAPAVVVKAYEPWYPDSRSFDARRYHLYYGRDTSVLKSIAGSLRPHDLAILDGRRISKPALQNLLTQARAKQARVIGYLSIGELDSRERERFDQFVTKLPASQQLPFDELALEWNEKFQSWRIDVSHPLWGLWIEYELQRLHNQAFHGVFLDTVDTADRYITYPQWSLEKRSAKVQAMIDLVRRIKSRYPQNFVLLNRGMNLIGEQVWMNEDGSDWIPGLALMQPHQDNPDAVLYENAFASDDAWTLRVEADLHATHQLGRTQVLTLGYQDVLGDAAAFFKRCKGTGWLCAWAESSTTLHQKPSSLGR